jgi:hypothetical protein
MEVAPPATARLRARETLFAAGVVAAVFLAGYTAVSPHNFAGYDEYVIRTLADRLVLAAPYANRPFNFLWTIPGGLIDPAGFRGFWVVHGLWSWAAGVLVFVICRRACPGLPLLAPLAAVFTVVWAPSDRARLTTVTATVYSGATLGTLAAVALLLEGRARRRLGLVGAAGVLAYLAIRGHEATLPLLLLAPLLCRLPTVRTGPPAPAWWTPWAVPVALALVEAATPALLQTAPVDYQMHAARLDPRPGPVARRLAVQYGFHLGPLASTPLAELDEARVAAAVAVCVLAILVGPWRGRPWPPSRTLAGAAAAGAAAAGLGYGLFTLSHIGRYADRTEFLSGPGIAVALAGLVLLAARPFPAPARSAVAAALAAWVVAVGTGRTLALQRYWDVNGRFAAQSGTLRQLHAVAPDVQPGTLIVLVDGCGAAWPALFAFRHAVEWQYGPRATGVLWGAWPFLYPTTFGPDGVRTMPQESIRGPWQAPPTRHGFDQVVAVQRQPPGCVVRLARRWPEELPPLPAAARYEPTARLVGRAFR